MKSKIEWTEYTWNPITGCTKESDGCLNCYAERFAYRLKKMGKQKYRNGFEVTCHPNLAEEPFKWKNRRLVFVCSMSDIFHDEVPEEFILELFSVMNGADRHIFQILTKRADRMLELSSKIKWTENIWLGVTVESGKYTDRIEKLKKVNSKLKYISFEPLLSSVGDIDLCGIDWVIVGGESGPGARTMEEKWVLEILKECRGKKIPFFFKQWGGFNKKKNGRVLKGRTWDQKPEF